MKVLALDYGAARTGVAVSDATGTIARPLGVVERAAAPDGLAARCASSCGEQEAERVVVGLPLTLRGEHGAQAVETEAFVDALRGVVDVPVETYDERFTTALAPRGRRRAPEDARAAAHLLESYLAGRAREREAAGPQPSRGRIGLGVQRAAVAVLAVLGVAGWLGASALRDDDPPPPPVETTPPLARLRIIFPEGFTRREMADRVAAVREIAIDEARRDAAADQSRVPRGERRGAVPPREFRKDWTRSSIEGFLFPATYEFTQHTPSRAARRTTSSARSGATGARSTSRYARSKNLTPYDVLIIASMIEKETVVARRAARSSRR